jgi:hypothetical protein
MLTIADGRTVERIERWIAQSLRARELTRRVDEAELAYALRLREAIVLDLAIPDYDPTDAVLWMPRADEWPPLWLHDVGIRGLAARRLDDALIFDAEQLTERSAGDVLALPGFGPACLAHVREALARHGLRLRGDD